MTCFIEESLGRFSLENLSDFFALKIFKDMCYLTLQYVSRFTLSTYIYTTTLEILTKHFICLEMHIHIKKCRKEEKKGDTM